MITPIDRKNIFAMLQSGCAADFILGLTVESLNVVPNRSTAGGIVREASPDFIRALKLIREVQAEAAMGMRVEEDKTKGATGVLFFRREDVKAETLTKTAEIRRLLKMPAEGQKFALIYAPGRGTDTELAVNSRSMLQIMQAFASYIDAPAEHVNERSALPGFESSPGEAGSDRVQIHSGTDKPANAFVVVR